MNAIVFVLDRDFGRVLLTRRKTPQQWDGLFNGVSTRVRAGETPAQAVQRKLKDDYGVEAAVEEIGKVGDGGILVVFRGIGSIAGAKAADGIKEAPVFMPIGTDFSREPVIPNLKWLLPLVIHGGNLP